MCTVTFIPRKRGYALAMNRDEKLTRVTGRPPAKTVIEGHTIIAPSEPGGGMWIALNGSKATLALINWYSIDAKVRGKVDSRGNIVKAVGAATAPDQVDSILAQISLKKTNAFRLIGIFPDTKEIAEWRWNLEKLVRKRHTWEVRQWISSGFDEPTAQRMRSQTFQQALKQASAEGLQWLRRLHRSHRPHSGPFSTCMHRADAATVSYTEIGVSTRQATMRYHAGSPCCGFQAGVDGMMSITAHTGKCFPN